MLDGAYDPHPGESTRDPLQKFVPHLEYIELDRCGPMPWVEEHAREPFLSILRPWLQRHLEERRFFRSTVGYPAVEANAVLVHTRN